jgi:xylulokinase
VKSAPVGADGVMFLPYLNGERTPNLPNGTGVIHGLRPTNMAPVNIARAAVEGATLGLAYGLKRFRDLGMNPTEIRLTGGGSKSAVWRQIAADCFNAEVVTLNTSEGAALGGAIQAAYAHGNQTGKVSYEHALRQTRHTRRIHPLQTECRKRRDLCRPARKADGTHRPPESDRLALIF